MVRDLPRSSSARSSPTSVALTAGKMPRSSPFGRLRRRQHPVEVPLAQPIQAGAVGEVEVTGVTEIRSRAIAERSDPFSSSNDGSNP